MKDLFTIGIKKEGIPVVIENEEKELVISFPKLDEESFALIEPISGGRNELYRFFDDFVIPDTFKYMAEFMPYFDSVGYVRYIGNYSLDNAKKALDIISEFLNEWWERLEYVQYYTGWGQTFRIKKKDPEEFQAILSLLHKFYVKLNEA